MSRLKRMLSVLTAALLFISILAVLPTPESTAQAAQPFTVILNPGHGPASTGSGAVAGGIKESVLNEQLTARVVSALKARGINVIVTNKMTSVANEAPYLLDERPQGTTGSGNSGSSNGQYHFKDQLLPVIQNPSLRLAGTETPNLLITLHHNSTSSSSVNGYEIYYSSTLAPDYNKTSDTVARSRDFANMVDNQFKQPGFYLARRGVYDRENNSLTKYPSVPAVLVEAGYMSNGSELNAIRSQANQSILADRLANAVAEYAGKYGNSYPSGIAPTPVIATPVKADSVKVTKNADGVSLTASANGVTGGAGGIKEVSFAVWPTGRQDLIKWIKGTQSGNNYSANINMRDIGNIVGNYTVHVYATDYNNTPTCIGGGKADLGSAPKGTVKVTKNAGGVSLTASANGVTGGAGGIKEVSFAVWPTGRQDLIKWIKGTQSGNNYSANINMRDVGNLVGNYTVHVYAIDYNNTYTIIGAGNVDLGSKPKGTVKIAKNADGASLTASANGVTGGAGGIREVSFAVWPTGRQDLIKWIKGTQSGNNYSANANISGFANRAGNYTVHVYAKDYANNDYLIGAGNTDLGAKIVPAKGGSTKINVNPANLNEATLVISNVTGGTNGIKEVNFAVWPTSDFGKLRWTRATHIGSDWATEINISQFGNTYGNYTTHVYATDNNGDQYLIGSANADLGGKVKTVTTNRSVYETSDMTCYIRPGFSAKSASVAVWSRNGGQDDLQWINAKYDAATDQWIANVQLNTFTSAGTFDIHAYAVNSAGTNVMINSTTVTVKASAFNGYKIMGASSVTAQQLANYITSKGWDNNWYGITALQFAQAYIDICNAEGVKAEVAFAQMCLETNNLKFGGDVTRDQFNFAGLGTTGGGVKGIYFANLTDGIKSQVQHLKRYASTDSFNLSIAPGYTRYTLVSAGCAPTVEMLSGKWATGADYGAKILNIIDQILKTSSTAPRMAAAPQMRTAAIAPVMLADEFEIAETDGPLSDEQAMAVESDDEAEAINTDAELKEEIISAPAEAELAPLEPAEGTAESSDDNEKLTENAEGDDKQLPDDAEYEMPSDDNRNDETADDSIENGNAESDESVESAVVNTDVALIYLNPQSGTQEQTQFDVSELSPATEREAIYAAIAKLAKSGAFGTEVIKVDETAAESGIIKVHLSRPVEIPAVLSEEQISDAEKAALAALADTYIYYIEGINQVEFIINDAPYSSANLTLGADDVFKELLPDIVRG